MATVISIVSGKGGSGKSLLTAVLGRAIAREGDRVLLVDMDIFVRGLTVLLFGFKRPDRREGELTTSDLLGVFSEQSEGRGPPDNDNYMINRFFECDVVPAVDNISAPLDYDDRSISNEDFCDERVKSLIRSVELKYDYILIDNRAGMDSIIAATCRNANIVLSIAEDDEVGRQTNANLVRFLQLKKEIRIVYTILNKGRRIRIYDDLKNRSTHRHEFSMLGVIPFDMDVMDSFGSDRFWTTIMETLYFRALIDSWNNLSKAVPVREISESKYNFPPKIFMQKSQGRYTLLERILRLYSVLFMLSGAGIWLYKQYASKEFDVYEMTAIGSVLLGALTLALSTAGIQNFLRGRSDSQEK